MTWPWRSTVSIFNASPYLSWISFYHMNKLFAVGSSAVCWLWISDHPCLPNGMAATAPRGGGGGGYHTTTTFPHSHYLWTTYLLGRFCHPLSTLPPPPPCHLPHPLPHLHHGLHTISCILPVPSFCTTRLLPATPVHEHTYTFRHLHTSLSCRRRRERRRERGRRERERGYPLNTFIHITPLHMCITTTHLILRYIPDLFLPTLLISLPTGLAGCWTLFARRKN